MDNLTWLKERKKGIGGSDVAAVLGLSKYKTALDVYLDKTTDEITVKESEALRQGKDLEPYVASRFTEETGLKVYQKNEILQHPEYPYIIANIDYFIEGIPAFLECKTTANKYNSFDFKNNIKLEYYCQVMHYLGVTGYPKAYLAVLVFGEGFYIHEIERDEEDIKSIINICKDFWENHVMKNIPPEPEKYQMQNKIELPNEEVKELGNDYESLISQLLETKQKIKDFVELQEELENQIKFALKDNIYGKTGKYMISWKPYTTTTIDIKRLKTENQDLYNQYQIQKTYRRMQIKEL